MSILTDKINNAIKEFYSFIDTTCAPIFFTLTWLLITVLAPLLATQDQGCPPPMFSSYDTFFPSYLVMDKLKQIFWIVAAAKSCVGTKDNAKWSRNKGL